MSEKILSHENGLELYYKLKQKYQFELELLCLNSEFFEISLIKNQVLELIEILPHQVLIKESEFHEESQAYYECSVFCNQEQLEKVKQIVLNLGLEIDIIHHH